MSLHNYAVSLLSLITLKKMDQIFKLPFLNFVGLIILIILSLLSKINDKLLRMNNVLLSTISKLIMYSRIYVCRCKNCVYAKPVVYRWRIQNTTEYGLFKDRKGMHVTLSGVCVLDYIFKNFVMTNCRIVIYLIVEWVSLHIHKLFQGIHKVSFIDDLH